MSGAGFKPQAAARALEEVKPGMRLGLGTGSTAAAFVDQLGALVADGLDVLCVPTSEATHVQAKALGIPLTTLDETPCLDLTVDGADEIDPALRLIKGGGGALLREKIVAAASDRLFIIADDSKLVETLGAFQLPIEVVPFGLAATHAMVEARAEAVGCLGEIVLRRTQSGQPFVTDGGHHILDCAFGRIPLAEDLALALAEVPGVVEHGLFLGLADCAAVAGEDGVRLLECPGR